MMEKRRGQREAEEEEEEEFIWNASTNMNVVVGEKCLQLEYAFKCCAVHEHVSAHADSSTPEESCPEMM